MGLFTSVRGGRVAAFGIISAALGMVVFGPLSLWGADVKQQPSQELLDLKMKFEGATGCKAANCHGADKAAPLPGPQKNEFNTWNDKDKHAGAYKILSEKASADIMAKFDPGKKATESGYCTNCHALNAQGPQMEHFKVSEGVTCNACHGPYEKWAEPHNKANEGANSLRKAAGYATLEAETLPYSSASAEHKKLLTSTGLFDTRPILARAEKCTSCHLAIDAKMVEAGHPLPIFELAYYTELEPPHWREPAGYWGAKVWAAGQVVCLRDAMTQLATRAGDGSSEQSLKDAYSQAAGHLGVFRHVLSAAGASSLDALAKDLSAAVKGGDKAKIGSSAKAIADLATKFQNGVSTFKASEGNTAALVMGLAKDADTVREAGLHGAEQQALGLSSLLSAYAKGKGEVAGMADVRKIVDEKLLTLLEPSAFKADDFSKMLGEISGKLAPLIPGANGKVPDPVN